MTTQRLVDAFLVAGGLLVGLGVVACSLQAPMPAFPMYTPAVESTGRVRVSVVPASFQVERSWDVSGSRPVLLVKISTDSHPGSVRVQVRRRTTNNSGGLTDELQDFGLWTAQAGKPSAFYGRYGGQVGPLAGSDEVVLVLEASLSIGATP